MSKDPTNYEDYLAMDRRTFGEYADRYVKEANARPPLSAEARECMESREVIGRLYHHLVGTNDSIMIQIKGDEVNLEFALAEARLQGQNQARLDKITTDALRATKQKYRFATGLNVALTHVTFLFAQEFDTNAVVLERNVLIRRLDRAREAVETQRSAALRDEDGTTDYDEDMWVALAWLIGETP